MQEWLYRKGNPLVLLVDELVQQLWKKVLRVLRKLKIELPDDLAIPAQGIYLAKKKKLIQKDTCNQRRFAVWLRQLKLELCNNLKG